MIHRAPLVSCACGSAATNHSVPFLQQQAVKEGLEVQLEQHLHGGGRLVRAQRVLLHEQMEQGLKRKRERMSNGNTMRKILDVRLQSSFRWAPAGLLCSNQCAISELSD